MQFDNVTCEKVEFAGLPLAMYREIAAHLRQVEGVEVDIVSQSSLIFDYNQSQVKYLQLRKAPNLPIENRKIVEQILAYYQSRYAM